MKPEASCKGKTKVTQSEFLLTIQHCHQEIKNNLQLRMSNICYKYTCLANELTPNDVHHRSLVVESNKRKKNLFDYLNTSLPLMKKNLGLEDDLRLTCSDKDSSVNGYDNYDTEFLSNFGKVLERKVDTLSNFEHGLVENMEEYLSNSEKGLNEKVNEKNCIPIKDLDKWCAGKALPKKKKTHVLQRSTYCSKRKISEISVSDHSMKPDDSEKCKKKFKSGKFKDSQRNKIKKKNSKLKMKSGKAQDLKGRKDQDLKGGKDQDLKGRKDQDLKGRKDQDLKGRKDQDLKGRKDQDLKGGKDQDLKGGKALQIITKKNCSLKNDSSKLNTKSPENKSLVKKKKPKKNSSLLRHKNVNSKGLNVSQKYKTIKSKIKAKEFLTIDSKSGVPAQKEKKLKMKKSKGLDPQKRKSSQTKTKGNTRTGGDGSCSQFNMKCPENNSNVNNKCTKESSTKTTRHEKKKSKRLNVSHKPKIIKSKTKIKQLCSTDSYLKTKQGKDLLVLKKQKSSHKKKIKANGNNNTVVDCSKFNTKSCENKSQIIKVVNNKGNLLKNVKIVNSNNSFCNCIKSKKRNCPFIVKYPKYNSTNRNINVLGSNLFVGLTKNLSIYLNSDLNSMSSSEMLFLKGVKVETTATNNCKNQQASCEIISRENISLIIDKLPSSKQKYGREETPKREFPLPVLQHNSDSVHATPTFNTKLKTLMSDEEIENGVNLKHSQSFPNLPSNKYFLRDRSTLKEKHNCSKDLNSLKIDKLKMEKSTSKINFDDSLKRSDVNGKYLESRNVRYSSSSYSERRKEQCTLSSENSHSSIISTLNSKKSFEENSHSSIISPLSSKKSFEENSHSSIISPLSSKKSFEENSHSSINSPLSSKKSFEENSHSSIISPLTSKKSFEENKTNSQLVCLAPRRLSLIDELDSYSDLQHTNRKGTRVKSGFQIQRCSDTASFVHSQDYSTVEKLKNTDSYTHQSILKTDMPPPSNRNKESYAHQSILKTDMPPPSNRNKESYAHQSILKTDMPPPPNRNKESYAHQSILKTHMLPPPNRNGPGAAELHPTGNINPPSILNEQMNANELKYYKSTNENVGFHKAEVDTKNQYRKQLMPLRDATNFKEILHQTLSLIPSVSSSNSFKGNSSQCKTILEPDQNIVLKSSVSAPENIQNTLCINNKALNDVSECPTKTLSTPVKCKTLKERSHQNKMKVDGVYHSLEGIEEGGGCSPFFYCSTSLVLLEKTKNNFIKEQKQESSKTSCEIKTSPARKKKESHAKDVEYFDDEDSLFNFEPDYSEDFPISKIDFITSSSPNHSNHNIEKTSFVLPPSQTSQTKKRGLRPCKQLISMLSTSYMKNK